MYYQKVFCLNRVPSIVCLCLALQNSKYKIMNELLGGSSFPRRKSKIAIFHLEKNTANLSLKLAQERGNLKYRMPHYMLHVLTSLIKLPTFSKQLIGF